MNFASSARPGLRPAWQEILGTLTWQRAALSALLAVLVAAALNPVFSVPFGVLVGRMVFIAALLLLAFGVAGAWHPSRMAPWLAQVLAVVVAAPVATLLAYLPSVGGDLTAMLAHEGRVMGFIYITATVLLIAPVLALPFTSIAVRPLARIFVTPSAAKHESLVGKVCTVRTGTVTDRFGEALLEDGGAGLVVRVRVDTGETLKRGDQVVIVGYDGERQEFTVAPMDNLLDERPTEDAAGAAEEGSAKKRRAR